MECRIAESEYRFLDILWRREPINSTELAKLCEVRLGWKKSTTYTVIKNLIEKHAVRNEHAVVTTLVTREQVTRQESEAFLKRTYGGDVPGFIAAFLSDRRLTREEADRLRQLIEEATAE
jgi:BlaI family penicillinase repressor